MTKATYPRTITGLIRSRMSSYKTRQFAGEKQSTFWEELIAEGYTNLSFSNFRTLYARARKQIEANINTQRKETKLQTKELENSLENKQEVPLNPLKKKTGFEFKGSSSFNEDDLF